MDIEKNEIARVSSLRSSSGPFTQTLHFSDCQWRRLHLPTFFLLLDGLDTAYTTLHICPRITKVAPSMGLRHTQTAELQSENVALREKRWVDLPHARFT